MSHDYVNFGFDDADVIVSVGYELQEFDPIRINPGGDKQIIHLSRFPAEVDAHYVVEVGIQADIGSTLAAICETTTRRFDQERGERRSGDCWPKNWPSGRPTTAFRSSRNVSSPIPGPPSALGHRPRRYRRREDVDGAPLPHLRTQYLPHLERALHHGVRPARGHRRQVGDAREQSPGRGRRRCVLDELPRDRDGPEGTDPLRSPDLGRRRLRPHRVEDGSRTRSPRGGRIFQPRFRELRRELRRPRVPSRCCGRSAPHAERSSRGGHGVRHHLPGRLLGEPPLDGRARRARRGRSDPPGPEITGRGSAPRAHEPGSLRRDRSRLEPCSGRLHENLFPGGGYPDHRDCLSR